MVIERAKCQASSPGISLPVLSGTYDARSQVTENPLPLLFRGPGAALTAPEEFTMVIRRL